MPRYLIEVPHKNTKKECDLAIKVFRETGSHFITHADFGCPDNVHKAWLNINVHDREDARRVVPRPYRESAKIIRVKRLNTNKVERLLKHHK